MRICCFIFNFNYWGFLLLLEVKSLVQRKVVRSEIFSAEENDFVIKVIVASIGIKFVNTIIFINYCSVSKICSITISGISCVTTEMNYFWI